MVEVPVGFKWFVPGLIDGSFGFGGEESAGASFLRTDGTTWTTDKDGIILALLASEILAKTGRSPSQHYADLVAQHGDPAYARIDAPATREQKAKLGALSPDDVTATELAGEPITAKLTEAPGNHAKIGGLKVITESAWFAARPSGTEDVYKIYAESFRGPEHLAEVQARRRPKDGCGAPRQPAVAATNSGTSRPARCGQRWSGTISASGSWRGGTCSSAICTSATRALTQHLAAHAAAVAEPLLDRGG